MADCDMREHQRPRGITPDCLTLRAPNPMRIGEMALTIPRVFRNIIYVWVVLAHGLNIGHLFLRETEPRVSYHHRRLSAALSVKLLGNGELEISTRYRWRRALGPLPPHPSGTEKKRGRLMGGRIFSRRPRDLSKPDRQEDGACVSIEVRCWKWPFWAVLLGPGEKAEGRSNYIDCGVISSRYQVLVPLQSNCMLPIDVLK